MSIRHDIPKECPQCKAPTDPSSPFCLRETCKWDLRHEVKRDSNIGLCTYGTIDHPEPLPLTEEHLLARWLKNHFPSANKRTVQRLVRPVSIEVFSEQTVTHIRERAKKNNLLDLTAAHVCADCNNQWMSQLQTAAQPIILKMAHEDWPELLEEERVVLARWAAMVAINVSAHYHMPLPLPQQRQELKEGRMPAGFELSAIRIPHPEFSGIHHHRSLVTALIGVNDEPVTVTMVLLYIDRICYLVSYIPGGNRMLSLIRNFHYPIGALPRHIFPGQTIASESKDVWFTKDNLIACGLEWAVTNRAEEQQ